MPFELMKSFFVTGGPHPFTEMFNSKFRFSQNYRFSRIEKCSPRTGREKHIYIIFPRARDFGLARFLPDVNGTVRHAVYKLWILQANKAIRVQVSAPEFKTHCIQSGC